MVPCGIFDDPNMVAQLKEASATIRKAMIQAKELHATATTTDLLAMNQMIRWIHVKEEHADKVSTSEWASVWSSERMTDTLRLLDDIRHMSATILARVTHLIFFLLSLLSMQIIKLVGEYCLCQRVKKDTFKSDEDYCQGKFWFVVNELVLHCVYGSISWWNSLSFVALKAHHAVMQAAMKTKQAVEEDTCDALDHALGDMAKMYLPVWMRFRSSLWTGTLKL
jgi:hypothetical protein